jgi:iron complex transport system ATP-binding protein
MVKLVVRGVECYYDSVRVLEDVSFSVEAGDLVGVIGPNGSGKTTLLKTVSGVLKPRMGAVFLDSLEIHRLRRSEVAQRVAVVPQDSSATFNFTVLDMVLMGRTPYMGRMQSEDAGDLAVAEKAMKLTNTLHLAERLVTELSGGERQRVIIARALAQEPKVLLLDEPTLHLDINHQIEIMELLKRLCRESRLAVLAVLHDFNLAARYCDSLILLNRGRIAALGSCEEVLTSSNIEEAFGVKIIVKRHPATGFLYVAPLPKTQPTYKASKRLKVHIVCGGGSGGELMRILLEMGYKLSTGVLNVIDSDYEAAKALGVPVICEAPFSPITDENHRDNLNLIRKADVVLVTEVPFGHVNLKNLEAVREALKMGKKVVVVKGDPEKERDYTGGKAAAILKELEAREALFVESQEEALSTIETLEREGERAV